MVDGGLFRRKELHTRTTSTQSPQNTSTFNSHISTAATVGILLGAIAALCLICLLAVCAYRRRMRLHLHRHVDVIRIVKPSHKAAVHLDLNAAHPIDEEKSGTDWWSAPASRYGSRDFLTAPGLSPYASSAALSDGASDTSYPSSYDPPSAGISRPASALMRANHSSPDLHAQTAWDNGLPGDPFARIVSPRVHDDTEAPLRREVDLLREEIRRMKAVLSGKTTKSTSSLTVANASTLDDL